MQKLKKDYDVLISTLPFGEDSKVIKLLKKNKISFKIISSYEKNNIKLIQKYAKNCRVLIAGTEKLTSNVLENFKKLELISRVGIGLNNIDLNYAKKKKIKVAYTPDAPSKAVSELTIGLFISCLRSIHVSNAMIKKNKWKRFTSKSFNHCTVGLIGFGRIGLLVYRSLKKLGIKNILVNDIDTNKVTRLKLKVSSKSQIYKKADIISLHLPANKKTKNLINIKNLQLMKKTVSIINTSRGDLINENDLYKALSLGLIKNAALDVFAQEPYCGELKKLDNCLLTSHMGSMTQESRYRMEYEATEDAVRYLTGKKLLREIPNYEQD